MQSGKIGGGERQLFSCKFFWFSTSFFRLPDSLYIIPVTASLITRFCYLSQVTYFHHKDTVVVKIDNAFFIFYFNIKVPIFIVTLYRSDPNSGIIYLFKLNRNTRKSCEICTKLVIKAPEWRLWTRSGVFNVSFEHTSQFNIPENTSNWKAVVSNLAQK